MAPNIILLYIDNQLTSDLNLSAVSKNVRQLCSKEEQILLEN
jgi:hypothetical protein